MLQPLKLMDMKWVERFHPREYQKEQFSDNGNKDPQPSGSSSDVGYTEQGMRDLDEIGDLVGGGDSGMLSILRPYYSMVEMAANGNRQGLGSYMHVLPDESYGDKPMYTLGASFSGGIEPAGVKHGFLTRPLG